MKRALVDIMMETMMAKMPSAEAKISITKILTKSAPFCASASAQPLPQMPTHTLRTARAHTCSGRERCGRQEPRRHA